MQNQPPLQNGHEEVKTYHIDILMPRYIKNHLPTGEIVPMYTYHSLMASKSDKYGEIKLPSTVNLDPSNLVEVETINDTPVKGVYRFSYDDTYDLCMAIMYENNRVKTLWLNKKDDKHKTLDVSKYFSLKK